MAKKEQRKLWKYLRLDCFNKWKDHKSEAVLETKMKKKLFWHFDWWIWTAYYRVILGQEVRESSSLDIYIVVFYEIMYTVIYQAFFSNTSNKHTVV